MNVLKKIVACIIICIACFGAGYLLSEYRRTNTRKPDSYFVDTSAIDRINKLARSGLIEQRNDLERERSEFDRERKQAKLEISTERDRMERERLITIAERERSRNDRLGIDEIERRCQDTIRIVKERSIQE
jgi:hypothetical protein